MSDARRYGRRAFKELMRSHHFKLPKYDLPLRIRPVSCPFFSRWYPSSRIMKHLTVVRPVNDTYNLDACLSGLHEPHLLAE